MITQDKVTGEIRLEDHPVRVEFLIHRGKKCEPTLSAKRMGRYYAKLFLFTLGFDVDVQSDDFEVRVIMQ